MEELPELSSSLEDYLETIYRLEQKNRVARVKDIADSLEVQMPSVSGALKTLRRRGLVEYEKNSYIVLTEAGRLAARSVDTRHLSLREFLTEILLLQDQEAEATACKIEHVVTPEFARRLANLSRYIRGHKRSKRLSREQWRRLITEESEEKES